MVIVAKFGGTSVKDGPTLDHIVNNIILPNPERRVIVISAPGKRGPNDRKVTDLLIQIGEDFYNSRNHPSRNYQAALVSMIETRFNDIAFYFGLGDSFLFNNFYLLQNLIRFPRELDNKEAYLDSIKPIGEIINAKILEEVLRQRGVDARVYLPENIGMVTDGNFGNAKLLEASYQQINQGLMPALEKNQIIVVPGFYGVDEKGRFTTFPRGGSDLTGAILANALNAKLYENWTDTDGIRRADPRVVENPDIIRRLTYREARELAYSGAEILHPDTLIPLIAKGIPLNVRNTFELVKEGTFIDPTKGENGHIVEGIAHKEGFAVVYIEKTGMNEEIGYISRLTKIFADHGVSIDQMTTSVDSVSVAVSLNGNNGNVLAEVSRRVDVKAGIEAVIKDVMRQGLADSNGANVSYDRAMVCVVGEGMRHAPGVLARLSRALESTGINIETVYQGPSERSVIFGLKQEDAKRAVQAIYNTYFGKQTIHV